MLRCVLGFADASIIPEKPPAIRMALHQWQVPGRTAVALVRPAATNLLQGLLGHGGIAYTTVAEVDDARDLPAIDIQQDVTGVYIVVEQHRLPLEMTGIV